MQIKRITQSDRLYAQECELRERVLLSAVGLDLQSFQREFPGVEERFEHYIAAVDHPRGPRVVGCALLLPEEAVSSGKLMQMATHPQRQREGIGRRLVAAIEQRAFAELGLSELYCHARDTAIPFYAALGWEVDSPEFQEVGIPHRKMVCRAPRPEEMEPSTGDEPMFA